MEALIDFGEGEDIEEGTYDEGSSSDCSSQGWIDSEQYSQPGGTHWSYEMKLPNISLVTDVEKLFVMVFAL